MKIIYLDFGEARVLYGSAASLINRGHEVILIKPRIDIDHVEKKTKNVIIGNYYTSNNVKLNIMEVPVKYSEKNMISMVSNESKNLEDIISKFKPDIIISGVNFWLICKKISNKYGIPLILWLTVVPSVFKLGLYLKNGRMYNRLVTSSIGFFYNILAILKSDFIVTNDSFTTKFYKKLFIRKIETIWPTYTKFIGKDGYKEFLKNDNHLKVNLDFGKDYILSVVTINKDSHTYSIEKKSFDFVKKVAKSCPELNFIVMGTSEKDINNYESEKIENLKLIGKIYDDSVISRLYLNSSCVICPIYVPGFVNRILESFYYGKLIFSTKLPSKYYENLKSNDNIVFVSDTQDCANKLKEISVEFRKNIENNSINYYMEYFDADKHAKKMEDIFNHIVGETDD